MDSLNYKQIAERLVNWELFRMSWWGKAQKIITSPSLLRKSARDTMFQAQKRYGDLRKETTKEVRGMQKQLEKSVDDLGTRVGNIPAILKMRSVDLGKQAKDRIDETMSKVTKKVAQSAREIPSKTAQVSVPFALLIAAFRPFRPTLSVV